MRSFKEILLEILPKDCWWEEMENLTNTPIRFVEEAAKKYAEEYAKELQQNPTMEILIDQFCKIPDIRILLLTHPDREMIKASCLHSLGDKFQEFDEGLQKNFNEKE